MKKILLIFVIFLISIIGILTLFFNPFGAPENESETEIVLIDSEKGDVAALQLEKEGYIKSFIAFDVARLVLNLGEIDEGGYYLSKNMNVFEIISELKEGADLKKIVIKEGIRKEQIGEILASKFNWDEEELEKWNSEYTNVNPDYREGVYFPDTYLIPKDEGGQQIALRMIGNFNEKFAPYQKEAEEKNIKWTTVLKIASLLEREAAGQEDIKLISGIIWNRLSAGQKLEIDATIQYATGKVNGQWWESLTGADIKNTDSPYNTYKYSGLPPTPIANPGITAIEAALNPTDTDCFFYLHDRKGNIYCSVTYDEHLENIEKYL